MRRRDFVASLCSAAVVWPLVARAQLPVTLPQGRTRTSTIYVGWYQLHPDVSLNFQLNRWAATGGPQWIADVRPELSSLRDYDSWRNTFVRLGEAAAAQGRILYAALHFRSAEFFMLASDPRWEPLRKRCDLRRVILARASSRSMRGSVSGRCCSLLVSALSSHYSL
jgi:hypothetical protein